jgi:electron transfer flavoprotein alpha subunit
MKKKNVMVFAEQTEGKIHPVTFELLGKGREMATKLKVQLTTVLLGDQIERIKELIYYGADKVFLYKDKSLNEFDVERYTQNIVNLVEEEKPEIFLFGATHLGRSLAPRVAVKLETGLTADCIGLDIDDKGNLIQIRPAFTGNILAYIKTKTRPQMCTVRYRVMKPRERNESRFGAIIRKDVIKIDSKLCILEKQKMGFVNLPKEDVIVSGGRGLKKSEDFALLKDLADSLKGVVGSSRPLVDDGWIGKEHQVGFSGNTVKPRLYVACGISGSPQHLAGMRDSDTIIAINIDPSAPIMKHADYRVMDDCYKIVPALVKEIKRRKLRLETKSSMN